MAADSKTEKATPKKRKDERKEGNVFLSSDIVSVVSVFGVFTALKFLIPMMYETISKFMKSFLVLGGKGDLNTQKEFSALTFEFAIALLKAAFPIMIISIALVVISTGAQTKFLFTTKKIAPKFSNINPLQGIKKMFSLKNVVELVKNLIKVILLSLILYLALKDDFNNVIRTMDMGIETSSAYMLQNAFDMVMKVVLLFVVIAVFDYMYQWWDYERQIKMSKEELKEEFKQTEGNPQIKGRIRDIQKQRARSRMMQAVPSADVIIRNPTHFAVALKYDMEKNAAPIVVAKGVDELALRIVTIAEENDVVTVENKPLARALYAEVEIGQEIPKEHFGAVAEILVYVYKLKNKQME